MVPITVILPRSRFVANGLCPVPWIWNATDGVPNSAFGESRSVTRTVGEFNQAGKAAILFRSLRRSSGQLRWFSGRRPSRSPSPRAKPRGRERASDVLVGPTGQPFSRPQRTVGPLRRPT